MSLTSQKGSPTSLLSRRLKRVPAAAATRALQAGLVRRRVKKLVLFSCLSVSSQRVPPILNRRANRIGSILPGENVEEKFEVIDRACHGTDGSQSGERADAGG